MRLLGKLTVTVFALLLTPTNLHGGGSAGGGSGLILDLDTLEITRLQFQALQENGLSGEALLLNGVPSSVLSVDTRERTVEVVLDGEPAPILLRETELSD